MFYLSNGYLIWNGKVNFKLRQMITGLGKIISQINVISVIHPLYVIFSSILE